MASLNTTILQNKMESTVVLLPEFSTVLDKARLAVLWMVDHLVGRTCIRQELIFEQLLQTIPHAVAAPYSALCVCVGGE